MIPLSAPFAPPHPTREDRKRDRAERRRAERRERKRERKREYRKTAAGRAARKRERQRARDRKLSFVALDGEGIGRDYVCLCTSRGDVLRPAPGKRFLRSADICRFLLDVRARYPRAKLVGFSLDYDANHWVRALAPDARPGAVETGDCPIGAEYTIRYRRRKWIDVVAETESRPTARVYDVFGFFQASFLRACEQWGVPVPDRIVTGKAARGTFARRDLDDVIRYCQTECEALEALMLELAAAFRQAKIRPRSWHGAGAAAAAVHQARGTKSMISEPLRAARRGIRAAYYGGRIEAVAWGQYSGPVWVYDIRSAYPAAARELPCLACGHWERVDLFEPGSFGVWRLSWRCDLTDVLCPLPWRHKSGAVCFPPSGRGWYHTCEAEAAVEASEARVLAGWVWRPAGCAHTWEWIEPMYRRRAERDCGPGERKALKLALNSLYGKLAQRIGHNDERPTYHCTAAAGYITARTRRTLWDAARGPAERGSLIFLATDAIACIEPLDLPLGDGLGEWECTEYPSATVVQSGVYWLGETLHRARGHGTANLDRAAAIEAWRAGRETLDVSVEQFVSLPLALAQPSLKWRAWARLEKSIKLSPIAGVQKRIAWDRWGGPDMYVAAATTLQATLPRRRPRGPVDSTPLAYPWDGAKVDRGPEWRIEAE